MDFKSVKCSECGESLNDDKAACPKCGSHKKHHFVTFEEKFPEIHDQLRAKLKRSGEDRPTKEIIAGYEKFKTQDKWVEKERVIDRENNQYEEVVVDPETGKVIHQCKETLTDHFGHGSAKFKKS